MKHPVRPARDVSASTADTQPPVAITADDQGADLELRIREAAYYRYLARGAEIGHEMEDWLKAEAEMLESEKASGPTH